MKTKFDKATVASHLFGVAVAVGVAMTTWPMVQGDPEMSQVIARSPILFVLFKCTSTYMVYYATQMSVTSIMDRLKGRD